MKFRSMTLEQKKKLLREEYLKDGAEESFVDELIPSGYSLDTLASVDSRLKEVFGYKDETEVTA
jgi:hypothetical protein